MKSITLFLHSPAWRARAGLYLGFAFNVVYAVFKLVTGIVYGTVWFYAAAVYYLLLCCMKFLLIRTDRRVQAKRDKRSITVWSLRSYKRCGALLLLLNISMAATVIIILKYETAAAYSGFVLWVFGGYTLIRIIFSAIDIKRFHKIDDPLLAASKHLGVSVTLMSMFSLSTALLDRFCSDRSVRLLLNGILGGTVCITVIIIALSMIFYSTKRLRNL